MRFQTHKGVTMDVNPPVAAGVVSTVMFRISTLPMLTRAFQTRDLQSSSLGNILLSNVGDAIHAVQVFSLPPGPMWVLHASHLLTTALMLPWHLRYERRPIVPSRGPWWDSDPRRPGTATRC